MENVYESERLRDEYLLFHYGAPDQIHGWAGGPAGAFDFPSRIVQRFTPGLVERALDLGCAVGRSAFEMSRNADEVVAIDYSHSFVEAGRKMQEEEECQVSRLTEGNLTEVASVVVPDNVRPKVISFEQGDALDLRTDLGLFDRVLAANLLCRLSDPSRLLIRLPELVKMGGELVLTTPCTWLDEFTPRCNWPVGSTRDWLKKELAPSFELLEEHDEPFLIRETARKFQWTVALLTKWRRIEGSGEVSSRQ
tara:strand:- start:1985 stop:2737 length:753 start_codon:yes stop_codon:yes gene_type:complete